MYEAPKEMSLPSDGGAFAEGFTRMGHRTQSWDSEAEGGQEGVNPVRGHSICCNVNDALYPKSPKFRPFDF